MLFGKRLRYRRVNEMQPFRLDPRRREQLKQSFAGRSRQASVAAHVYDQAFLR